MESLRRPPSLLGTSVSVVQDTCGGHAVMAAQVADGRAVLPTGWKRAIAAERDDPLVTLSKRQMEVLQLLAQGCSYEEIGMRLFISLNTVKFHVQSIFSRLGVRNRMAAARILDNRH